MTKSGFTLLEVMIFTAIFSIFLLGFIQTGYMFYESNMNMIYEIQNTDQS